MPVVYRVPLDDGEPYRWDDVELPPSEVSRAFHSRRPDVIVDAAGPIEAYEDDDAVDVVERNLDDPDDADDGSGAGEYTCDECDQSFPTEMSLRGHKSAHS